MFTHINHNNQPTMVDVTDKTPTLRSATATVQVQLPLTVKEFLQGDELVLKKGPVFQTAIIAGTMAVKRTHEMIPFCHHIPVEGCKLSITMDENFLVSISCKVRTTFKTGVEMEALHGATIAALTVYDMCKAISHEIIIKEAKLTQKTGGKGTILDRPLYGLVLTGGKSERMGEPKALINYKGKAHGAHLFDLLSKHCEKVFLSSKNNQWKETNLAGLPSIVDKFENSGPMGGMLSAFQEFPEANWFVVACDLVHFNEKTMEKLLAAYNKDSIATCYKHRDLGFPEALCGIYTPAAKEVFEDAFASEVRCPVKVLKHSKVELIDQEQGINLANINTQQERQHEIH